MYILWMLLIVGSSAQIFNPSVIVNSCINNKVTVAISGAANGGIVYVQGAGPGCKQTTFGGSELFEFVFLTCGIAWGRPFRIVIQKKALYQTAEDKIIPVTCIADLSDITIHTSLETQPKEDEHERVVSIKPSASMRLYSGGSDVGGKIVKLSDIITLKIELHNQYKEGFDVLATSCRASSIPLVAGGCPIDVDLFPQFTRPSKGVLTSTFKAFVPTEQANRIVTLNFTCTLDVCLTVCPPISCPIIDSNGRKRRNTTPQTNTSFDHLQVDSTLTVSTDGEINIEDINSDAICISRAVFAVFVVLMSGLVIVTIYCVVLANRWRLKYNHVSYQYLTIVHAESMEALNSQTVHKCVHFV